MKAGIRPVITDLRSIESAAQAVIADQIVDHPEQLH